MEKIRKWNIFVIFFMLFLISVKTVAASPHLNIPEIPIFIQIFTLVMGIQIAITIAYINEIKKVSPSKVWNLTLIADFFSLLIVVTLAMLLYKLYFASNEPLIRIILPLAALFEIIAHISVNVPAHLILKPIIKKKMNLLRLKYIALYFFFVIGTYIITGTLLNLKFLSLPMFSFIILVLFVSSSFILLVYFVYYALFISKSYKKIGFVDKPFFIAGFGGISFILSLFLVIFCATIYAKAALPNLFFNLFFYLISCIFAIVYYICFIIEYPSLLQPKWKAYMPFDIVKVTAATTLAFLTITLFFTVMEHGTVHFISLLVNIPHPFFFLLLLPFSAIILILAYTKALSSKTKLKYWTYMRYGILIHLIATFYVLCLAFLLWSSSTSVEKLIFSAIFALSFAFYLFFALDLWRISKKIEIKPDFDKIVIARYITSLYSLFFLILLSISFTYKKDIQIFGGVNLELYPFFIFFILSFLIAFVAYLKVPHKGFEKVMPPSIFGALTYLTGFAIFILVYFIFVFKADMQYFPLRDFFFIAYFTVLITAEIASITSLVIEKEELSGRKRRKEDIVDLLNLYASKFYRLDYLEDLWEKTVDRYVPEDEVAKIGFDASRRRFQLEKIDEHTRLKIAVGMLLGMHESPDIERSGIMKKSIEETKAEIEDVLKEKLLMLPEALRHQFDEGMYYPILYEEEVNSMIRHVEAFIPFSEQEKIFDRLKKRDEKFECIGFDFENGEIRIKHGTRFSRSEFLELFKLYLQSLEDIFPFRRFLLYELIREEIKGGLVPYGITISELLDVVPTGVEKVDEIIAGGLVKRSSTLLVAEETKTKHKILLSFIKQGLEARTKVIFATSRRPFQQIMGELRIDIKELKELLIIDLYEDIYTEERVYKVVEEEHRITIPLNKILFQRNIVKTIKSYPKDVLKIVVIDVYDDFSKYHRSDEMLELLQKQIDGFKRWNCTSLITINPNSYLIKREGEEVVKKNFDNVMILSGEDKDASVFIERLHHGTPSRQIIPLY